MIKTYSSENLHTVRDLEIAHSVLCEVCIASYLAWPRLTVYNQMPFRDHIEFVENLVAQCKPAATQVNLDWLAGHYSDDVDTILNLRQKSIFQLPPQNRIFNGSSVDCSQMPSQVFSHAISSYSDTHPSTVPTTQLTTPAFEALLSANQSHGDRLGRVLTFLGEDYYPIDTTSASPMSAEDSSDKSRSPTSSIRTSPSPSIPPDKTECRHCSATFSGSRSDRRKNLSRHMAAVHSMEPKQDCPVAGCEAKLQHQRPDNLKRHLRNRHGLIVGSKLPKSRRRTSDKMTKPS